MSITSPYCIVTYDSQHNFFDITYPSFITVASEMRYIEDLWRALFDSGQEIHDPQMALVDMSLVESFDPAAYSLGRRVAERTKTSKVAVFGARDDIAAIHRKCYEDVGRVSIVQYFKTRELALQWLLGSDNTNASKP